MLSILVCAVLGQFKVGDLVELKPGGKIHESLYDAIERGPGHSDLRFFGVIIYTADVAGEQVIRVESPLIERPYYMLGKWAEKLDESTAKHYIEEHRRKIRQQQEALNPTDPATIEARRKNEELAEAEEKRQAEQKKIDAERKALEDKIEAFRKFARNKPENEVLDILKGNGWDPVNLTSYQVNKLTPSQRKAISGIKLRYIKATAKKSR